jgi:hypothetical protein
VTGITPACGCHHSYIWSASAIVEPAQLNSVQLLMTLVNIIQRIKATRIVTPSQERQINQLLWQTAVGTPEYEAMQELTMGIITGQIRVLSQIERFGSPRDPETDPVELA